MDTRVPPGQKSVEPPQNGPNAPDDLQLAPGAFDLLNLGPEGSAQEPVHLAGPKTHDDGDIVPSELWSPPDLNDKSTGKNQPFNHKALAVALVFLGVVAGGLWQQNLLGDAHGPEEGPKPGITPAEAALAAVAKPVTQATDLLANTASLLPLSVPPSHITPLSEETIDAMDYPSLMAVLETKTNTAAPDLRTWALFRLAMVHHVAQAKDQLLALARAEDATLIQRHDHPPRHQHRSRGRGRHKIQTRRASALSFSGTPSRAVALAAMAWAVSPQHFKETAATLQADLLLSPRGQWLYALALPPAPRGHGRQNRRDILTALCVEHPAYTDGQLALAQDDASQGDHHSAITRLSNLVTHASADVFAQSAHVLWQGGYTTALAEVLDRRWSHTDSAHLAAMLAQASPAQRSIIRRLVMRHSLMLGDRVGALSWAMAQASEHPQGLASQWDVLRLAHLNHTAEPNTASLTLRAAPAEDAGTVAIALVAGAQALEAPTWLPMAHDLLAKTHETPAASQWVVAAIQAELAHQKLPLGLQSLRGPHAQTHVPRNMAQLIMAKITAHDDAARIEALQHVTVGQARLDDEILRPDVAYRTAALVSAAEAAHRPILAAQAAQQLLWQDPLAYPPTQTIIRWAQAQEQTASDGPSAGLAALDRLIAQQPNDDHLVHTAAALAHAHHPDRVPGYVQTLLLRHPGDVPLTAALAEAYIDAGNVSAAKAVLAPLLQNSHASAQDANLLYAQARAIQQEEPTRARSLLVQATGIAPQARAFAVLAQLAIAHNLADEALANLNRATELAPQDSALQLQRARVLLSRKDLTAAGQTVRQLLTWPLEPITRAQALELAGDIAREAGETATAAVQFEQAIRIDPERTDLTLKLARLQLQELGRSSQALGYLQALTAKEPQNPVPFYFLGIALRDVGARKDAAKAFTHYLHLAPQGEYATDAQDARNDLALH